MYKEKERRSATHEVLRIAIASGQLFLKFNATSGIHFALVELLHDGEH
jgi:hypothetical protein